MATTEERLRVLEKEIGMLEARRGPLWEGLQQRAEVQAKTVYGMGELGVLNSGKAVAWVLMSLGISEVARNKKLDIYNRVRQKIWGGV
ncbi:hypothetical protein A3H89_03440 [Candidatus Amesbacteria bacterium RIFCSPLOWO2_02_FULL_48_11]|uniref:Uncharacterized protein n=1 Tax=Candidatus Amesbacteria bacterium GW2011_GWC1_48_10 TaxID=1618365 RepID=A0A0G1XHC2_9BACT|nr:MAG: hypothetical protein UY22_C0018G0022 [Candidatus Amesbacteria bacterium GW2011_GWC1_48_10]OGC89142.1 MAG: hypothetical protein A2V48_00680 [Candidatus Amesbacteria bacterium RBG_19FT_COMBO_48_16]OGC96623.1 MAG: hypothetical protein A3C34_00770 [Candidatus Amesbacteria bacterium RIFCSPHIGHO2_02_FULL_48_21]OGC98133.1 MAG: hypothetical protein A2W16_00355 [Candidatus Amesbacteria bacterium RBG_16_48_31]OGD00185.1 MAG: hypothetical protein A2702_01860 [Candidatus Amesbacteria bacterium RIFC